MLTTNVTAPNAERDDAITAFENLEREFADALPSTSNLTRRSVLGNANAISQADFTAAPGPYDIVVVASTYTAIHPTNWDVLQNAIAGRWANSIVFFVDGCCERDNGANAATMVAKLNAGALTSFAIGNTQGGMAGFPLNTNSPYAASFGGLNPLYGGFITYINNVPANNAVYLNSNGLSPPPAGTQPVNNVFGLLIPTAQSNGGAGSCVFAVVDATIFANENPRLSDNKDKIGRAFINAATSETGACGLPKVSKSFDKTSVTLGGSDNTTVLTISLSNGTPNAINNVRVTDNLPAPLVVADVASSTCTAGTLSGTVGSSTISHTGFTIPAGGCSITVPVAWPNSQAGRAACINTPSVTNTITPGTDFVSPTGQINMPATAQLACSAAQLTVSKQVTWPANVTPVDLTGTSFPVSVACTGTDGTALPAFDTAITLTTPTTGSVSITPVIASGSCVATEGSRPAPPANYQWLENPPPSATATLAAPPAVNSVQLVNTLAGSNTDITISKSVAGGPAAGVSGSFSFTANCGASGSFTTVITLSDSNTGAIALTNVPMGASCTVSQNPTLPAAPAGYAWSGTLPAPVSLVTGATGNTASFVNTLVRTTPAVATAVPGLKDWGLAVLALMMLMLGAIQMRRRSR